MFLIDFIVTYDISLAGRDSCRILRQSYSVHVNAAVDGHVLRQPFDVGLSRRSDVRGGGRGSRHRLFITGFEHHGGMMVETLYQRRVGRIRTGLKVVGVFTTIALCRHTLLNKNTAH